MYTVPKPPAAGASQPAEAGSTTSASAESKPLAMIPKSRLRTKESFFADAAFRTVVAGCALALLVSVGLIFFELVSQSHLSRSKFGFQFLIQSIWDPVAEDFGALPFIYGTLVSSFVALLAAIPSVIYGLWGIFVLAPFLRFYVQPFLGKYLGWTGLFTGPKYGWGMLAAGVILAIMILPIVSSITREVILAVPRQQREAALALGATRWEMLRISVLRNARTGIMGAIILGLGRAFGETMAVTMVIGNRPQIVKSLFAPGYTLASVIANEFTEAVGDMHLSALTEAALILFAITLVVNAIAGLLVWSITRGAPSRTLA